MVHNARCEDKKPDVLTPPTQYGHPLPKQQGQMRGDSTKEKLLLHWLLPSNRRLRCLSFISINTLPIRHAHSNKASWATTVGTTYLLEPGLSPHQIRLVDNLHYFHRPPRPEEQ